MTSLKLKFFIAPNARSIIAPLQYNGAIIHDKERDKENILRWAKCWLHTKIYTTFTNFSMKYLVMCKVYTDVGGIK